MKVLIFLFLKRILARLNKKNNIFINIFCYENDLWYMFSKIWLEANGKQNVKLESGSIKFKNYFKQLTIPFKLKLKFKLCANLQCLKSRIYHHFWKASLVTLFTSSTIVVHDDPQTCWLRETHGYHINTFLKISIKKKVRFLHSKFKSQTKFFLRNTDIVFIWIEFLRQQMIFVKLNFSVVFIEKNTSIFLVCFSKMKINRSWKCKFSFLGLWRFIINNFS